VIRDFIRGIIRGVIRGFIRGVIRGFIRGNSAEIGIVFCDADVASVESHVWNSFFLASPRGSPQGIALSFALGFALGLALGFALGFALGLALSLGRLSWEASMRSASAYISLLLAASLIAASCSVFVPARRVAALTAAGETMSNGYLIHLRSDRPLGPTTALLSRGRWVLVTVADSLVDAAALKLFRGTFVDSVEVSRFPVSLQISFHLTVEIDAVEVVHEEPGNDVLISLFAKRKDAQ